MRIGNLQSRKGDIAYGSIKVGEICDSTQLEVPLIIIKGAREGQRLWIQNGVHGDELVGIAAIHKLIEWIDPQKLTGTVILVPMLNISAYRSGKRMAPQDGLDMNRIWPGSPINKAMHLWAHSELVADTVVKYIKDNADAVLDIHDAGLMGIMSPYVSYYTGGGDLEDKVRRLAFASGMDIVWETQTDWVKEKVPGSLKTEMGKAGIPSITLEVGGEGRLTDRDVSRMFKALQNVMKHLGMVEGDADLPKKQYLLKKGNWLRATRGGVLLQYCNRLKEVKEGELLAITKNLYGQVLEEFRAPSDGICIGFRTLGIVQTGMYVVNIGS